VVFRVPPALALAASRRPVPATGASAPIPARPVADSIGPVVPTNSATQRKPCATTAGSASPAASPAGLAAPTTLALTLARSATPQATASCVVPAATSVVPSTPVSAATPSVPLAIAFPAERRTSSAAQTTYATLRWCVPVEPAGCLAPMAEARLRRSIGERSALLLSPNRIRKMSDIRIFCQLH
jgi:hypothetical protein